MQKRTREKVLKITVPAHKPIKRGTLARIIKDAEISLGEFLGLL